MTATAAKKLLEYQWHYLSIEEIISCPANKLWLSCDLSPPMKTS